MRIQGFKRIIAEDYDQKDRKLIQKIAYSLNTFADDISTAFNKNIDLENNLNIVKKTLSVTTNASGVITVGASVKTGLGRPCDGTNVINVTNITNPTNYPSGGVFISFTENTTGIITINNITNLPINSQLTLRVIFF